MHTPGHVGIALLTYAPVGTALALHVDPRVAAIGGITAVGVASLPDLDAFTPIIHRGPTHTLPFALVVSGAIALSAGSLASVLAVDGLVLAVVCGCSALLSLLAHVAADSLTPMGIWPFWPISNRHYSFAVVRSKDPVLNWTLFVTGVVVVLALSAVLSRLGPVAP